MQRYTECLLHSFLEVSILFILFAKCTVYFVNFNCKIKFVQFPRSSSLCTIMAERPSGTRSYRTSRRFSKKRNKFHTIELRNRGSHPLRVLSSLEGIISRYRASQADSIDSFTTWKNRFSWLRIAVWRLFDVKTIEKIFLRQCKTSREILEIFSDISLSCYKLCRMFIY